MLKTGDFSRLAQVSVKALRHYGRLGLLKPAWIDRFTGYRYYSLDQLPRLNRILALKDLGFSLEQVGQLLRDDLPPAELRGRLRLKRAELERQARAQRARLARVDARLRQIEREGGHPEYEIVLRQVKQQRVVGIRDAISAREDVISLFHELRSFLQSHGVTWPVSHRPIAVYFDTEHHRNLDVEAAVPVSHAAYAHLPTSERAMAHVLRGAETMACAVCRGSHETPGDAYRALTAWAQANGYRSTGPNREVYLQGLESTLDSTQCVVEVQLPVENHLAKLLYEEEEATVEPKIVTRPAFEIVGVRYYGLNQNNEIAAMWNRFGPRMHEIAHSKNAGYGLCSPVEEGAEGRFEYVAGTEVDAVENVPEGMVSRQVPAGKYAVVPCTIPTIGKAYETCKTWLPTSDYEWSAGPDFELYYETFDPEDPESVLYVYVPVVERVSS